jgi:hypothetical protein
MTSAGSLSDLDWVLCVYAALLVPDVAGCFDYLSWAVSLDNPRRAR